MKSENLENYVKKLDRELIEYLFLSKVATFDRIRRDIYKTTHKSSVYKRLKWFCKLGLLQRMCAEYEPLKHGYSITTKCFKYFIKQGLEHDYD